MVSDQISQTAETSRKIDEDYIVAMGSRLNDLRALLKQQETAVSAPKKRSKKN